MNYSILQDGGGCGGDATTQILGRDTVCVRELEGMVERERETHISLPHKQYLTS